jgi:hypothetical protein
MINCGILRDMKGPLLLIRKDMEIWDPPDTPLSRVRIVAISLH